MSAIGTRKNYAALDGIRGYAALLVTLTHFVGAYAGAFRQLNVERASYFASSLADTIFIWLYLNMTSLYILLTISGFMVCRMVMRPSYGGYGYFMAARALRIYPPLLFALAFSVAIGLVCNTRLDFSPYNLMYNLLALNGVFELKGQPYDFPSWSLFYEIVFCLFIPGLVWLARRAPRQLLAYVLGWSGFLLALGLFRFSGWMVFIPFIFGSVLAQVDDSRLSFAASRIPTAAVVLAYVAINHLPKAWAPLPSMTAEGVQMDWRYIAYIGMACGLSCLMLIKAVYARSWIQRVFSWRPLEHLGKMSYSLYLLHAPLIGAVFLYVSPFYGRWLPAGGFAHFAVLLASFWALSIAAAMVGFHAVEMIYFRSRFSSRSGKAPPKPNSVARAVDQPV